MIIIIDSDIIHTINGNGEFYIHEEYRDGTHVTSQLRFTPTDKGDEILIADGGPSEMNAIFEHIIQTMVGSSWPNIVIDISSVI